MVTRIRASYSDLFPAGTIAYHPYLQYCYILKSQGTKRVISYQATCPNNVEFKVKTVLASELQGATA